MFTKGQPDAGKYNLLAIASQIPPNDGFFLNTSLDDLSNLNSYWLEALFTDDNSLNPSKKID